LNRISVTVTPSSGSAGFIAYLTNSSGTVIPNSQTGLAGSGWKCDTSTTWSAATSCSFVGTGSKIINQVEIGKFSIIGAGAVVSKNIPANCTAVGVPAKPIKFHE
jgi:hypothetical protein